MLVSPLLGQLSVLSQYLGPRRSWTLVAARANSHRQFLTGLTIILSSISLAYVLMSPFVSGVQNPSACRYSSQKVTELRYRVSSCMFVAIVSPPSKFKVHPP